VWTPSSANVSFLQYSYSYSHSYRDPSKRSKNAAGVAAGYIVGSTLATWGTKGGCDKVSASTTVVRDGTAVYVVEKVAGSVSPAAWLLTNVGNFPSAYTI